MDSRRWVSVVKDSSDLTILCCVVTGGAGTLSSITSRQLRCFNVEPVRILSKCRCMEGDPKNHERNLPSSLFAIGVITIIAWQLWPSCSGGTTAEWPI